MSFEATTWALNIEGVNDSTSRVILLGLASHAHKDGTAAWPSVATLAAYAVCSERTVHRRLRELEEAGLIRRGDQLLVGHLPPGRRPVVYDLPVGVSVWRTDRGDNLSGVSPRASRGDTGGSEGVTTVADKPSLSPYGEKPSKENVGDSAADAVLVGEFVDEEPAPALAREDVAEVCQIVADHVTLVTGSAPRVGARWEQQARLMLDADGHTVDDVRAVMAWVSASAFWAPNVLSVPKLREKWPTLVGQARRDMGRSSWLQQELGRAAAFAAGGGS